MGKKKGAKKGGGDDYWDEAGEDIAPVNGNGDANGQTAASDEESTPVRKSAFAAMTIEDPGEESDKEDAMDVDDKDKSAGKDAAESKAADDGKADNDAEEQDDGTPRLLTKKEKERLKKEKEKAKKKAQAQAKKANDDDGQASSSAPAPAAAPAPVQAPASTEPAADDAAAEDDDDGEEEGGATAADKKKKKKKKKGTAAEVKPEPAAASKKKPSAAVQALKERQAAVRRAEEEARQAEEEARRKEEEAERAEKEEAERKEAERLRRKEKEKAKRDQLKKEGKLLTPKQKAEKAAAEARMKQMIATGAVRVDGLMKKAEDGDDKDDNKERRRGAVNDRKKKKGPSGPPSKLAPVDASAATNSIDPIEDVAVPEPEKEAEAKAEEPAVDAATDDATANGVEEEAESSDEDVKDDWDAESEEEDAAKPAAPAKSEAPAAAAVEAKKSEAEASKAKATAQSNGKAAATAPQSKASNAKKAEESSSEEDSSDDSSDDSDDGLTPKQRAAMEQKQVEQRQRAKHEAALREADKDNLRSPICCIMGHVDTGKTKLLDKIRQTNVQGGEAGGITQQIGATYFPESTLRQKIASVDPDAAQAFKIPGLLVIDTPGHESFTNLRKRGSSLCNIAILVVDIMHGLEQQTLESIRLLRDRKTPFVVALNKIDRLYGWQATPDGGFRQSLAKQNRATQNEFHDRLQKTIVLFAEQGLNAVLYYDNKNFAKNVSLVPTSAHTGEGIPDMLQLLVNLTQDRMSSQLMYLSELECTILEVKIIEGLGTTIDVILSNGVMHEGDTIVLCGINGPIVTQVRALLTPQPLREMRVKGSYVHHKMVKAALGVKISAPELEGAISGSRLLVCGEDDDVEDLKKDVMSDFKKLFASTADTAKKGGVWVQASTLGSLEALVELLNEEVHDKKPVPIAHVQIGPLTKNHVRTFSAITEKSPDNAVMLCFDVQIEKEAEKLAEELNIKIFSARIIYHLYDAYDAHRKEVVTRKQKESADTAVWPCRLRILACFAKRAPIILGCEIITGDLRLGTPLCVKNKETGEIVNLGRVTSLEVNHKRMDVVTAKSAGAGVAVRIECAAHENPRSYGRHFDDKDELMSHISRQSIDTLKELFWDQVSIEQKRTIKHLKEVLGVQ